MQTSDKYRYTAVDNLDDITFAVSRDDAQEKAVSYFWSNLTW